MQNARWMSLEELSKEELFSPFGKSLKMLIKLLTDLQNKHKINDANTDGAPFGNDNAAKNHKKVTSPNLTYGPITKFKSDREYVLNGVAHHHVVTSQAIKMKYGGQNIVLPDNTDINAVAFAGKDTNVELRNKDILASQYGGKANDWQHCTANTKVQINNNNKNAEIHWFEESTQGQCGWKVKRFKN